MSFLLRALLLTLAATVAALDDCTQDDMIPLVTDHDSLVLLLYTPDCEPCKKLETDLDTFKQEIDWDAHGLKHPQSDIVYRKINLRAFPGVERMVQVTGVPSLILIKGPWVNEYSGIVTKEVFGEWIAKRVGNVWEKILKSDDEVKDFLESHDVSLVLESTEEGRGMFEVAAGSEREFATYAWRKYEPEGKNTTARLIVKKYGTDAQVVEIDVSNTRKLYEVLAGAQLPRIAQANPSNIMEFLREPKPIIWLICETEAEYLDFKKQVKPLLKPGYFPKDFYWLALIGEKEKTARDFAASTLRVPKDQKAGIVVSDVSETGRWVMESVKEFKDITVDGVKKFIQSVQNHTIEKFFYSQETISAANRYPLNTKAYRRVAAKELEDLLLKEVEQDTVLVISDPNVCDDRCTLLARWGERLAVQTRPSETKCIRVLSMEGAPLNELDSSWKFPNSGGVNAAYLILPNKNNAKKVANLEKFVLKFDSRESLNGGLAEHSRCDVTKMLKLLAEEEAEEELAKKAELEETKDEL